MKTLDLFCGTKSFSKIANQLGFETYTLDILEKFNPTFLTDIMTWDYKQFEQGYFDIIWASPDCKNYSSLNFFATRKGGTDLTQSNNLIKRTLEIIAYLKPTYWFLENPQTGKLKHQSFMIDLPYNDVDYCKYGFNYRKRTRIWNNSPWKGRKLCKKPNYCDKKIGNKHKGGDLTNSANSFGKYPTWEKKISIPSELIEEIVNFCFF